MEDFKPVQIVEEFFQWESSKPKAYIMELPRCIETECRDDNDCRCANLCYVVKNLEKKYLKKYLSDNLIKTGNDKNNFNRLKEILTDISLKTCEKISFGKELLFVKNFTEDEKNTVCKNIDTFFSCVAGLGVFGVPLNALNEKKITEIKIYYEEKAESDRGALLGIFNKYCKV